MIPRRYGKHSTPLLQMVEKLKTELNEANYSVYTYRIKQDLLKQENQRLKELLKECGNGLDKIKHIAEVKNLAAVYQVAERTLAKIDEVLKWVI